MDMNNFGRVAKIFIDPKANEGYVADGYFNKRVAVIDLDSGKIKRFWGAYGEPADDAPLGPVRSGRAGRQAVPHARALRRAGRTTAWSTCATVPTIACRSSRAKASS